MDYTEALKIAQDAHPLDLVARLDFIEKERDAGDLDDREAWAKAARVTRNGVEDRAQRQRMDLNDNTRHSRKVEVSDKMADPKEYLPLPATCQIDTCGENRDGTPWPASEWKTRDDGTMVAVCSTHAEGWDD